MKSKALVVALAGLLLSNVAQATDGNDLLRACQAAVRTMNTERVPQSDSLSINNGQAARIVTKHLYDNPADLNLDATLLMILAFKAAYPCK